VTRELSGLGGGSIFDFALVLALRAVAGPLNRTV
jgi:hypothetical protein